MSRTFDSVRGLFKKSDMLLMGVCVLLAALFLGLAAKSAAQAGAFISIDNLFFLSVCMLLALVFLSIPAMTLRERGMLKNPFTLEEGVPAARAHTHVHFEGGARLFLFVLGGLLLLTLVEVLLAYFHVPLVVMLTILMGLSVVKAALIMAYFMHLKFERLSLVLTLVPILVVCICLLFVFFPDSSRSRRLRATPVRAEAPATTGGEEATP